MLLRATIFGFAIIFYSYVCYYYPKIIAIAIAFPVVTPVLVTNDAVVPLLSNIVLLLPMAIPPKEPLSLNCNCLSEPPGEPATSTSTMLGFVPSSAFADKIFQVLLVAPNVTLAPEPETY